MLKKTFFFSSFSTTTNHVTHFDCIQRSQMKHVTPLEPPLDLSYVNIMKQSPSSQNQQQSQKKKEEAAASKNKPNEEETTKKSKAVKTTAINPPKQPQKRPTGIQFVVSIEGRKKRFIVKRISSLHELHNQINKKRVSTRNHTT